MRQKLSLLVMIFIVGLILNLLWEFGHARLYISCPTIATCWPILLRASAWDALFITTLYVSTALLAQDFFWMNKRSSWLGSYVVIMALGAAMAVELNALSIGRWAYTSAMPIIPLLHAGLSPLVQLPVTAVATYWVTATSLARSVFGERQ